MTDTMLLRPMHHHAHGFDPIIELHCWVVQFEDGHEEIVLRGDADTWGVSTGPRRTARRALEHRRAGILEGVSKLQGFKSLRLASFVDPDN